MQAAMAGSLVALSFAWPVLFVVNCTEFLVSNVNIPL
jgi:hypothetical protein